MHGHYCTYRGKHNLTKLCVLLVLAMVSRYRVSLTMRQLSLIAGVSYVYLAHRLSKWVRWRYIRRYGWRAHAGGYKYRIAKRGVALLRWCPEHAYEHARACVLSWHKEIGLKLAVRDGRLVVDVGRAK